MKKTSIGGQAIYEGIMMRGPFKYSIAVRKENGEIELKTQDYISRTQKNKILAIPIIRGITMLCESLSIGSKALEFSTSFYEDDNKKKKETSKIMKVLGMLTSFFIVLLLFFIIPTLLASIFKKITENSIVLNLIEGFIRIFIFLSYLILISKVEDMRRFFMYHGAEHKSIFCYENGEELTIENVRKYSPYLPRCGTSFLFSAMMISIIILSFFGFPNPVVRILIRILFLPLIVGISYELNKFIGARNSKCLNILAKPGLFIQKIATVKEPDDKMIEVAIVALKEVIPEDESADIWR